jgi:hypothetical protein
MQFIIYMMAFAALMSSSAAAAAPKVKMEVLRVGDSFKTCAEFECKLFDFERQNCVQLYKRDARTVSAAQKRVPNWPLNYDIKYYEIRYCCISGGTTFKARGRGIRETS